MFGIYLFFCVFTLLHQRTYSLSDGDLRLVLVDEMTSGSATYPHKTISYVCRSTKQQLALQTGSRSSCGTLTGRRGHQASFYNNPIATGCSTPLLSIGNDCYEEVLQLKTYEDAKRDCHLKVADLAKVTDTNTNTILKGRSNSRTGFILGPNDLRQQGQFEYGLDEPVTFTDWYTDNPDRWLGRFHCIHMWYFGWLLRSCTERKNYFCSRLSLRASISCSGTETRLDQCTHGAWTLNSCGASEVVKVSCSYFYDEGGVPAESTYTGMVQMYYQNRWRFICSQGFGREESAVVCRQMRHIPHISNRLDARTDARTLIQFNNGCVGGPTGNATCGAIGGGRYTCPSPLNTVECQETQTCVHGYYGPHCQYVCGHCARGDCSSTDGTCPGGDCLAGYTSNLCNQACQADRWGPNCANSCGHCVPSNGVICDPVNGICTSGLCQDGYDGDQCTEACPVWTYGGNCSLTCGHCLSINCNAGDCPNETCNAVDGICPSGRCKDGYIGERCDQACQGNRWGPSCAYMCGHCVSSNGGVCNPMNGICVSGLCQDGYTGQQCTQACPIGTYGGNCSHTCGHCLGTDCDAGNCTNATCNAVDGICPSGRCKDGYIGERCDEVCPQGTYGANCSQICGHCLTSSCNGGSCTNTTCNATNGICMSGQCKDGYIGEKCVYECPFEHWGPNCLRTCGYCKIPPCGDSCSSCDAVDGVCLSGLCQDGYMGDTCIDECPPGKWGAGCSKFCNNCPGGSCDPKDGLCICSDGYKRTTCETGDLGRLREGDNKIIEDISLERSTWVYYLVCGMCFMFLLLSTCGILQYVGSKKRKKDGVAAM